MYIRSSPRGPNRDPNRTLSNELLLLLLIIIYNRKYNLNNLNFLLNRKDIKYKLRKLITRLRLIRLP